MLAITTKPISPTNTRGPRVKATAGWDDNRVSLRPSDLTHVALTLGGSAHVSRAELEAGAHSLRAYTKSGRPRLRRGSLLPLYVSAALIHPAYKRTA